jgi:hypothetical protein
VKPTSAWPACCCAYTGETPDEISRLQNETRLQDEPDEWL